MGNTIVLIGGVLGNTLPNQHSPSSPLISEPPQTTRSLKAIEIFGPHTKAVVCFIMF